MDDKQLKTEVRELRNVSKHNKIQAKKRKVRVIVDDVEYEFRIRGIGNKAVKLELYVHYEDIIKSKNNPIEKILWEILTDVYEDTKSTTIGERRVFI